MVSVVKYTLLHIYIFFKSRAKFGYEGWGLISYRGDHLRHETTASLIDKY